MVAKRKAASTLMKRASEEEQAARGKVECGAEETPEEEWANHQLVAVSEEDLEEQAAARRLKELKGTPVSEIKKLIASLDLDIGNKQEMIVAILNHEKNLREQARAHENKIRAAVSAKKCEFEMQPVSALAKMCAAIGVKGEKLSKPARVQCLLRHWQENDGIDKVLATMAFDARKVELEAMEKVDLRGLCEQAGLDPFVSEAMVDRIVKKELEMGRFKRPALADLKPEVIEAKQEKVDMVTALLQSEQNRKKENELKQRREETVVQKIKELQAMSAQDLKNELTKKGAEATGKKEDMVKALCEIRAQEDKVSARKAEIKAMGVQAVKEICVGKGLKTGAMNEMITTLLAYEAKVQDEIRTYDAKFAEVLAEWKQDLKGKTAGELKELCASKGLKLGTSAEERLGRLAEDANKDGEIDRRVAQAMRKARMDVLLKTDKKELVHRCEEVETDPLVKEVMVERILNHETECGQPIVPPPAKKARLSKK